MTIVGDTIYAPTEHYTGAISHYLSAYDLETGEVWRGPDGFCAALTRQINAYATGTPINMINSGGLDQTA